MCNIDPATYGPSPKAKWTPAQRAAVDLVEATHAACLKALTHFHRCRKPERVQEARQSYLAAEAEYRKAAAARDEVFHADASAALREVRS